MIGFRLDADNTVGMGHLGRCLPLALEFMRLGKPTVFFCRDNAYIRKILSANDIPLVAVPCPNLDDELDFILSAAHGCDMLILDSYRLSDSYIDNLNAPGRILCCMDDTALYTYSCDVLINPHPFAKKWPFKLGRKQPALLVGGEYWVFRDEFTNAKPIEILPRADRVLVLMGGADVNNCTPGILRALADESVYITAVVGQMAENYDEVMAEAAHNARVTVVRDPPSMSELMAECGIAISAGGNTVYELCVMGVPTIVLPQTENERIKVQHLADDGIVEVSEDIAARVSSLCQNHSRRLEMSIKMQETVKRDGKKRLASELVAMGGSLK